MKLTMKTLKILTLALFACIFTGCKKSPTEGIIQVIKLTDSSPVANASVKIYVDNQDPNSGFFLCNSSEVTSEMIYTTSSSGVTEKICFELPAVLKVDVTANGGLTGSSTLSLVEGETTTLTVKVN